MSRAVEESNRRMLRARDVLDREYAQALDVPALARVAHVSPAHSQIYVLDQDAAIDFYVGKLGLEITADVDMGFMRWLTVSVPGHPERQILLEKPGAPAMSEETAEQVRELVTKGAMGGWLILTTDDCRKTYETLLGKGVEFTEEPTERPYGIDCGLRDPFGNRIRLTQPKF